jgi:calcineurin-like phosphoesterase family protein
MRTLAIGDIHGCHVALTCLLAEVRPRADDRIIFLGDYIDRGPASRAVVESVLDLGDKCASVFLRGNHEVMILDAREDALKANLWQSYGGFEALMSYGAGYNQNWVTIIPEAHWKFFERTARYFETEDHIFVHACLDAEADMDDQPDWLLYWESVDRLKPHKSGKRIVCGHSPQRSGRVLDLGFAVCIDTGAVNGAWLTCLDVTSGDWWQTNEKRETRHGSLSTRF